MKKRVIIVHGWGGSPTDDWIGWATEAFQEKGYEVLAPEMPDTDNPVLVAKQLCVFLKQSIQKLAERYLSLGGLTCKI